uniref:Uncharacterized protein n=1 Tax=viral metagenome TaxID=1070528 RepID=A0A6C0AG08_9ZZZZ
MNFFIDSLIETKNNINNGHKFLHMAVLLPKSKNIKSYLI